MLQNPMAYSQNFDWTLRHLSPLHNVIQYLYKIVVWSTIQEYSSQIFSSLWDFQLKFCIDTVPQIH